VVKGISTSENLSLKSHSYGKQKELSICQVFLVHRGRSGSLNRHVNISSSSMQRLS
jgi:hypothetical protein